MHDAAVPVVVVDRVVQGTAVVPKSNGAGSPLKTAGVFGLDLVLKEKVQQALAAGLKIIFCCGEPLGVRNANEQETYVLQQLQESLFNLNREQLKYITIAYEPIWAIGTGLNATAKQAQEMHAHLRKVLAGKYGQSVADNISILYGGSVKGANAKEIFSQPDVDGGLVGGASLTVLLGCQLL
mgnify:CR=1 FL=1